MNLKLFAGTVAIATALSMPAMADQIGCDPGASLYFTQSSRCDVRTDGIEYELGTRSVITAPGAYAYAPRSRVYTSEPYAYTNDPYMASGVGVHAGPVGFGIWAR
jgi:hypothetical protein